jgi:hypothetical protein
VIGKSIPTYSAGSVAYGAKEGLLLTLFICPPFFPPFVLLPQKIEEGFRGRAILSAP